MRLHNLIVFIAASWSVAVGSAASIQFSVTPLPGAGNFRYNYTISGINFQANQDLDLIFPIGQFTNLTNPVAGAGFTTFVFQPNNPIGFDGDFILFATVNNPSLAGPFGIDVTFLGSGQPGAQAFMIDQFDGPSPNANFVNTISSGTTQPAGGTTVPEPSAFGLAFIGIIAGGGWAARRRFFRAV